MKLSTEILPTAVIRSKEKMDERRTESITNVIKSSTLNGYYMDNKDVYNLKTDKHIMTDSGRGILKIRSKCPFYTSLEGLKGVKSATCLKGTNIYEFSTECSYFTIVYLSGLISINVNMWNPVNQFSIPPVENSDIQQFFDISEEATFTPIKSDRQLICENYDKIVKE